MTSAASEWAGARARLSLADHQTLRRPGEVAISADGTGIAWSLPAAACIDPPDGARSAIWVVVGDGEPRQLTDGRGVATLPRWSPDGASLAYAADAGHAGRLSTRVQRVADRSAAELEGIPGSVEDLRWSGDGRRLLVLAADLGSDRAGSFQATRITEPGAGGRIRVSFARAASTGGSSSSTSTAALRRPGRPV